MTDFSLIQIIITNANRFGVLSNMTVDEVCTGHKIDDQCLVTKLHPYMSPATVVLSSILYAGCLLDDCFLGTCVLSDNQTHQWQKKVITSCLGKLRR